MSGGNGKKVGFATVDGKGVLIFLGARRISSEIVDVRNSHPDETEVVMTSLGVGIKSQCGNPEDLMFDAGEVLNCSVSTIDADEVVIQRVMAVS